MPTDWYDNFASLAAREVDGVDFRISVLDRQSEALIMAPHGGHIEPGTSKVASAIARSDYSLYLFEGLRPGRAHCELHITSHNFDEPRALEITKKSSKVIAVHGRANGTDAETTWLGGRDVELATRIREALCKNDFRAIQAVGELAGMNPRNICNRSSANCGVQLEIPRALRDRLVGDVKLLMNFAEAVRQTICS